EEVVEFYNRGGDRRGPNGNDTTGFGPNSSNAAVNVVPLKLTPEEKAALVEFLKALTDERVRQEQAPFDHPQIFGPNGHPGDENPVKVDANGVAVDSSRETPAVGAAGRPAKGLPPLTPFLD